MMWSHHDFISSVLCQWLARLTNMEFCWERKISLVVGVDDLASSSNEHGCILMTCGCGGTLLPKNGTCYIGRWRRCMSLTSDTGAGSGSLATTYIYTSATISLLMPINTYVFVCLILAILMSFISLMSPIFVNLGYLANESCLYVLVTCFFQLVVFWDFCGKQLQNQWKCQMSW